jgi:hypothetical protein
MLNGIELDRKTEQINQTALELERVKSFLESCIAPNSLSDEVNEFFREVAALKNQSVQDIKQETMAGIQKYLEAVEIEIAFKNDLPTDIDKYAEKLDKVAQGIESCWDILSLESRDFFINLAYAFTKIATSKLQGIRGLWTRFKLLSPSLKRQENLFEKYKSALLFIPEAVDRTMTLRQSKSAEKLEEKAEFLLRQAKGSSLLPYMKSIGADSQEQEEIENQRSSNLELENFSGKSSLVSDDKFKAIAYSMDALIPGFYCWLGPLKIRIGGSEAEENYPGIIHSFAGVGLVLPGYHIYTTYQGSYDPG